MTKKKAARYLVKRALLTNQLKRGACAVCGCQGAQAHHHDYDRPLDVTWLCRPHHFAMHGWKLADRTSVEIEIANTADSYAEIGDRFGISRERVRQIAKAMGAPARPRVYARVDGKFARAMA